jgi:hypothetical protein
MSYAGSLQRYSTGHVGGTVQDAINATGGNDPALISFLQMNGPAAAAIAAQTGGPQNTTVVLLQAAQCPDLAQAVYNGGLITKTLQTMISDKLTFCTAAQKVADYAQPTHTAPEINNQPAPVTPAPAAKPAPTPYMAPSSIDWGLWIAIALGLAAGVGGVVYYKKHHKRGRRR